MLRESVSAHGLPVRAVRIFLLDDTAAAVRALQEFGDTVREQLGGPAREWFRARN